jgi:Cellulase (glycosyl hydrolase family 5).
MATSITNANLLKTWHLAPAAVRRLDASVDGRYDPTMNNVGFWPHTRPRSTLATTIFLVLVVCLVAAGAVARPGVAHARAIARGIADYTIISMSADQQATALHEIRSELGATYVRFFVSWRAAEPRQGAYDRGSLYMAGVASAVSQAHDDGLKVMISFQNVPEWASAHKYWPQTGGYQPYDAISTTYLPDYEAFCQAVAARFRGQVYAYECWNEPNLWTSLFPQTTRQDKDFAAHLYVKMLRSFSAGIRAGAGTTALRVAGATAPAGSATPNDIYSTSPQRFAATIKATKGWSSLFDAYSHHPYTIGAPEAAPTNSKSDVTLQNLGVLLKLFPDKPFFLTEYGYQTAACQAFLGWHVNQVTQANYLRRAYSFAARYRQVKLLMWYLVKDYSPPKAPYQGWYTGLRTAGGAAKRAWFVFAGGNRLTLDAPSSVKRGTSLTLGGQLACKSVGGLSGKALVVQSHRPGRPWYTLKTVKSQAAGLYAVLLRPKASAYYRVAWLGVVTSRSRYVAVH